MNRIDKALFYDIIALFLTGIIFVYSSSYYIAGLYSNDPYYFSIRQIVWSSVSFIFLLLFMQIDFHNLKRYVKPLIFITFLLLLAVFIPGIGRVSGGAHRWIDLRLFEFNPSELAKVTVIIYLSYILTKKQSKLENFTFGFLPPLLIVASIFFIILIQSNFTTAAMLLFVSFLIFFIGGASLKHIFSIMIISLPVLIAFIIQVSYRKIRILSYLNPWADMNGSGYHTIQSLKAFANGGFLGMGLGNSIQKMGKLPAPHNDFIFSIIVEEMGIIGSFAIGILFIIFFIKGTLIAKNCPDKFGQLLAYGITMLITTHAFMNMGIAAGIFPPTGVSLPFISYGGSSILFMSICCGILLNIGRQNPLKKSLKPMHKEIQNLIDESM
jgi:cell division protein FtsW